MHRPVNGIHALRSHGAQHRVGFRVLALSLMIPLSLLAVEQGTASTALSPADILSQATEASLDDHRIVAEGAGARITCRLQALEGRLDADGLTLHSVGSAAGQGSFQVRVQGLGRDRGPMTALGSGVVAVEGDYARLLRAELIEEISTSAGGIRQDFLVLQRPAGSGALYLDLSTPGAALESVVDDQVRLAVAGGRSLAWHTLHVTDADDRVVAARFAQAGDRLRIVVEDAHARYPLRIDPTFTDVNWFAFGGISGANNTVYASVIYGGDVVIGGAFTTVHNTVANSVARWDGSTWSSLGTGTNGGVYALAVLGTDLYVGGWFTTAGGVTANRVARWDGSAWSSLGTDTANGVDNTVYALAVLGTDLHLGGLFITAGGVTVNRVARWDGSTWSSLGTGANNFVRTLAVSGTDLYAGGMFTTTGGVTVNRVARWDGSAWSSLGTGSNGSVQALAVLGTNLYMGGWFTTVGGVTASCVARWDGSAWSSLGSGANNPVNAMAVSGTDLYIGGQFTTAGGVAASRVARWDGSAWSSLGAAAANGVGGTVDTLAVLGTDLYVGGQFTTAGGVAANRMVRWDGSAWSSVGNDTAKGVNNSVRALAVSGTDLYVGGSFTMAGGVAANRVARWDGSAWSSLGTDAANGVNSPVHALAVMGTDLYIGGEFTTAGGVTANRVARWNGSAWSALGTGTNSAVKALLVSGTDLYIGGEFTTAGGVTVNRVARWNGSVWSSLGTGANGYVEALTRSGTDLFIGGSFTTAGGVTVNRVARWNGSAWSSLGTGVNNTVRALAVSNTDLYLGGSFTTAGGVTANRVARWDGSAWSSLGTDAANGVGNNVWALAVSGTDLYVGGQLTAAGEVTANHVTRWDGSAWSSLGTDAANGVDAIVRALVVSGTDLYLGGDFTTAGGALSTRMAKATPKPPQTITFPNPGNHAYGATPFALSATASSGLPISFSVISGPATWDGSVLTLTGAGTVVVAADQAGDTEHAVAPQVLQSITVAQAPVTVTANNQSRAYGAANPPFTSTITGFLDGDDASVITGSAGLATTADATSALGDYAITVDISGMSATNYSFTGASGTLTVSQAVLTVTADNASRAYGAANPTLTATITGLANGDDASVITGNAALATAADASSTVGDHAITVNISGMSATNYSFAGVVGTLTVGQAVLTVTADNASRAYGAGNPVFTSTITGFVNADDATVVTGSAALATSADVSSSVSDYAITVDVSGMSATNYSFAGASGTLTVGQVVLTVTADNASRAYGAANPTFTATITGYLNTDDAAVITGSAGLATIANTSSPVGDYAITVDVSGMSATNYSFADVSGTLTVGQAVLTVTADNTSRAYGAANPVFTATITGFANADDATVITGSAVLATSADVSSLVSDYAITVDVSDMSATNYSFADVSGTLTVGQAVLTVTADNTSRAYGAANPTFTRTITGFVNADDATVVTGSAVLATPADASSAVGDYAITVDVNGMSATNYSFADVSGTLTVGQAVLTVTADNTSRAYGAANPAFTRTITGFANADNATVITGSAVLASSADASSAVGDYAITVDVSGMSATNYSFADVSGTLTVGQAVLTVTADNTSRAYGAANPTFTATITGFANADDATVITGSAVLATSADVSSSVSDYAITVDVSGMSATNYSFAGVAGRLTVQQAALTITTANTSRLYGAVNPTFTIISVGFVNDDDVSDLIGTLAFSGSGATSTVTTPVGSYDVVPVGLSSSDYAITFVLGTLQITGVGLIITADDQERRRGAADPPFTVTYSGFVNGENASVLSIEPTVTTTATAASPTGLYPITPAGAVASNYVISYEAGNLAIYMFEALELVLSGTVRGGKSPAVTVDGIAVPVTTRIWSASVMVDGDGPHHIEVRVESTGTTVNQDAENIIIETADLPFGGG